VNNPKWQDLKRQQQRKRNLVSDFKHDIDATFISEGTQIENKATPLVPLSNTQNSLKIKSTYHHELQTSTFQAI